MTKLDQKGAIPILILVAIVGLVTFFLISNTFSFQNRFFSGLFTKPSALAAAKPKTSPTPTPTSFPFPPPISGTKFVKVAVVALDYPNSPNLYTESELRSLTYTGGNSAKNFFIENNYNLLRIQGVNDVNNGDVYMHVPIQYYGDDVGKFCPNQDVLGPRAYAAAGAAGIDLSKYDIAVFSAFHQYCSSGGFTTYGGATSTQVIYINGGVYDPVVLNMLLGKEFGFVVSRAYRCIADGGTFGLGPFVPISKNCMETNPYAFWYVDPFDVMGGSYRAVQMNSYNKAIKPGYPLFPATDATTGGIYTIAPIEASSGLRVLRIPRDQMQVNDVVYPFSPKTIISKYYYLTFHQPIGLFDGVYGTTDPAVNGVTIHLAIGDDYNYLVPGPPHLIDTTASTIATPNHNPDDFRNAPLTVGKAYSDPLGNIQGIGITTKSVSSSGAVVEINFYPSGQCVKAAPLVSINPTSISANAGQTKSVAVTVTSNDNIACTARGFTIEPILPSLDWIQNPPLATTTALSPGQSTTLNLSITASKTASTSAYPIQEIVY